MGRAGHEVVFSFTRSEPKLKMLAQDAKGKARAVTRPTNFATDEPEESCRRRKDEPSAAKSGIFAIGSARNQ